MTAPAPSADSRSERERRSRGGATRPGRQAAERVEVVLEHARFRHLGWTLFGLIVGLLFLTKLGTVGQMVGLLLLAVAARNGYSFVRTLRFDAGTIAVDGEHAILPVGLCSGRSRTVPTGELTHAYCLRRAVPWTQASPVLVIEVGDRAYVYPRDWFASESDQRRIIHVVRHHAGQEQP
ncbi:hypothetical protein [Haliangium sp.]|uniref:hypothetical protein n=1 Tax=Haliangium sp. TaxID=2663208 RepID=UPI003D09F8ED